MKTAILTGASAGLGEEFALQMHENFPEIECLWLIARRKGSLEKLAEKVDIPCRIVPMDLCDDGSFVELGKLLGEGKPDVRLLINCAGCGDLGLLGQRPTATETRITDLNITALTAVTNEVLPYVSRGGNIINISSIASFCPNPRMTVYSASKAYVSAFSRGLGDELRGRGIRVTAVCPGPMDTEFLDIANITGNSKMFKTLPHCDPEKVVAGSYAAARKGREVYTPGGFFKFYRVVAKIVPQKWMVKLART